MIDACEKVHKKNKMFSIFLFHIVISQQQQQLQRGSSMSNAASSCEDVANSNCNAKSGMYFLKDRQGTVSRWFCEMEMNGGGWLLLFERNSKLRIDILNSIDV